MQSEHAHLDMNYGVHTQQKVSHEFDVKELAKAALKKIPGADDAIRETFDKSKWQVPHALPGKKYVNEALSLGF